MAAKRVPVTPKIQTQIRMEESFKNRIRAYQRNVLEKKTGAEVTFTTAVRSLIEKGLKSSGF